MAFLTNLAPQKRVFAIFFLYAIALGGIYPRLGEIQLRLGIEEGALGIALMGLSAGVQISFMFGGGMIQKLGHRGIVFVCTPMLAFSMALATMSPSVVWLFFFLLFAGLFVGVLEVVINVEADRIEHMLDRRVMNRSHAFWSFGFFAAGITGMIATFSHLSPSLHLFSMAIVISLATFLVGYGFVPAKQRASEGGTTPKFVRPTAGILLLVGFTLSAMLLEGSGADWSVIYMRDVFGTPQYINVLAFAAGALTQAISRYFTDQIVDRFGPLNVARTMVIMLGTGALLVTSAQFPAMALLGFALIGVGTSGIFPLAMSAAAQRTDRPAAVNVAAIGQLSFVVFLVAPPLLGIIAETFGIRFAFGVGLPLVILSWFTVSQLTPSPEKVPGE